MDVGKAKSYVVALRREDDEELTSRAAAQTEADMRAALLEAVSHGTTLPMVD